MTEPFRLVSTFLIEIPMLTVLLSRVLNYRLKCWFNVVAGLLTIGFTLLAGPADLDDYLSAAVQIRAMVVVAWYARTWRDQTAQQPAASL